MLCVTSSCIVGLSLLLAAPYRLVDKLRLAPQPRLPLRPPASNI